MIKAVFFDIDGTLVTKKARALASTRVAIKALQQQGIICGLATGRGPLRLSQQIDELNFDVFITYNGQLVYTKEQRIRSEYFSKEVLNQLVTFSDANRRQTMFGSARNLEGSTLMQAGQRKGTKKLARFLPKKLPVSFIKAVLSALPKKEFRYKELDIINEPIYQCVMLSPISEIEKLRAEFPECHITRSNPYMVDIIPKGGSKLKGIQACVDYFGISMDEVMVFGDSWNDAEMLQGAGIGVAMGNADEEIKQLADYVTDTNEKDGIYKALQFYDLI